MLDLPQYGLPLIAWPRGAWLHLVLVSLRVDYVAADTREGLSKLTNFRSSNERSAVCISEAPVGEQRRLVIVPCTFEVGKPGKFEIEVLT